MEEKGEHFLKEYFLEKTRTATKSLESLDGYDDFLNCCFENIKKHFDVVGHIDEDIFSKTIDVENKKEIFKLLSKNIINGKIKETESIKMKSNTHGMKKLKEYLIENDMFEEICELKKLLE